jgi:hypothetical protein
MTVTLPMPDAVLMLPLLHAATTRAATNRQLRAKIGCQTFKLRFFMPFTLILPPWILKRAGENLGKSKQNSAGETIVGLLILRNKLPQGQTLW